MDKLELDVRMARLERRVSMLTTVLFLAAAGATILIYLARFGGEEASATAVTPAVMTPAPAPPPPTDLVAAAPVPGLPFGLSGGNIHGEGTMGTLHHQLSTLKQLRDEGMINDEEWRAKKSKVLAEPLTPGDLRSDLGMVKQLRDSQVICDDEQAALRTRMLGIEPPREN